MSRPPLHSNKNFPKPLTSVIYRLPKFTQVSNVDITTFFENNYHPIIEGDNIPKQLNPFFDKYIKDMNKSLKKDGILSINFEKINQIYNISLNDQYLLDENSDLVTQAILNELFYRDLLQKEESDSEDDLYS